MKPTAKREYKVFHGTSYDIHTPDELVHILHTLWETRQRVVIVYGNVETGEVWENATPARGRIGRSTGESKIPLLIRTSRSLGGEALMDNCILQIKHSPGERIIYTRKTGK